MSSVRLALTVPFRRHALSRMNYEPASGFPRLTPSIGELPGNCAYCIYSIIMSLICALRSLLSVAWLCFKKGGD